jgi:hypothetical protein
MTKTIYLLLTLTAGIPLSAATIPIRGLCNTGHDSACTSVLALGSPDGNWSLNGNSVNVAQNGAWLANNATSAWIGEGGFTALGGFYSYTTSFNIPASFVPALTVLAGRYSSDNELTNVLLNGVSIASFPLNTAADFDKWTNFMITGAHFASGVNTLTFVVRNRGVGGDPASPTPLGLRVEFTGSCISDVPEPGTYFLSAAALMGLAWIRRKQRA